jgi:hypothetical protein
MPINESTGIHPSNLTEKQQKEAMRSIYGLNERETMSPTNTDLTYEERVKLRRMLDNLDQKEAGGTKEFDLNKPPVPPYVYREFPYLMYNHETKSTRPARNHEEREHMLAEGWSTEPFPVESPEIELTAAERAEAEEIDKKLVKKRRV